MKQSHTGPISDILLLPKGKRKEKIMQKLTQNHSPNYKKTRPKFRKKRTRNIKKSASTSTAKKILVKNPKNLKIALMNNVLSLSSNSLSKDRQTQVNSIEKLPENLTTSTNRQKTVDIFRMPSRENRGLGFDDSDKMTTTSADSLMYQRTPAKINQKSQLRPTYSPESWTPDNPLNQAGCVKLRCLFFNRYDVYPYPIPTNYSQITEYEVKKSWKGSLVDIEPTNLCDLAMKNCSASFLASPVLFLEVTKIRPALQEITSSVQQEFLGPFGRNPLRLCGLAYQEAKCGWNSICLTYNLGGSIYYECLGNAFQKVVHLVSMVSLFLVMAVCFGRKFKKYGDEQKIKEQATKYRIGKHNQDKVTVRRLK